MLPELLLKQITHTVNIVRRKRKNLAAYRDFAQKIAVDTASPYAEAAQAVLAQHDTMDANNRIDEAAINSLGEAAQSRPAYRPTTRKPTRSRHKSSPGWLDRLGDALF